MSAFSTKMAAAASQSWSVVGKSTKKTKHAPPALTKDQKKTFMEKMPRIEPNAPVKESSTIYDAFLGKEKTQTALMSKSSNDVAKQTTTKKKKTDANSAADKKKEKPMSFDEAASKIDKHEMALILTQSQTSFPDNKDVWMKNLASYLNLNLENVPETDPVFKGKPKDFPLSKLNSGCRELLKSSLKNCNSVTLEHLFYHCVQTMLIEMGKGVSTYGYRIFLQILAAQMPTVVANKNVQYMELLNANKNRPANCLSIMWALGQGGAKDLRAGLKVWLDLMLPLVTVRSLASYCVDYLENLLQYHSDHKAAYGVMTIRDFFPILDLIFGNTPTLQTDLKKRLLVLYPKLKTIAVGADPKSSLRLFFPSFLSRATPDMRGPMKNEILPCLITCLSTDEHCFSVWRQMYIKHLPQSSVLLEHISVNWSQLSRKLGKKRVHETLQTFSVTNDELTAQGYQAPEETGCSRLCRELLLRMGQPTVFSWFWLLFLVVGLVAAIISYDVYTAKNYKLSRSWRFLEEYGILAVLQQGWSKTRSVTLQIFGWLQVNVPFYYARTCDTVGPYLRETKTKVLEWYAIVYKATEVQRHWISVKTAEFISWAYQLSPEFWEKVKEGLVVAVNLIYDFCLTLAKLIYQYSQIAYVWVIENIITDFSLEKVGKLLSSILLSLQKILASFIQWCRAMFETATK